ncbi:MAG: hypothetical protein ABI330_13840 [Caldimonas sp.]
MKEWLQVDPEADEDWLELAREALDFVGAEMSQLVLERSVSKALAIGQEGLPAFLTQTPAAAKRTLEFFTANIRNPNTRKAHARTVAEFSRPGAIRTTCRRSARSSRSTWPPTSSSCRSASQRPL